MTDKIPPASSTISDVERDLGVAKETLRVWERRYAFPRPLRNIHGERAYPADQLAKLRLVKQLLDLGHRPGKILHLEPDQLRALALHGPKSGPGPEQVSESGSEPGTGSVPALQHLQDYLDLVKAHRMNALRGKLSQALLVMGLRRFVIELVAPLTGLIGDAWASARLAVFEEHLFTESLKVVMRSAILSIPRHSETMGAWPRIMLTTLPQERHSLGLLMAEALFALEGAHCISLGVQTPLIEIVDAARSQDANVVALSFSGAMNPRQAQDALAQLRARLPETIEIWAGGQCPALRKRLPAGARALDLNDIAASVRNWCERHRGA
jgi:MerR family transcriptional regulator, light-induced transcriptional regulator